MINEIEIRQQTPYNYSAAFWTSDFSIPSWERPKTHQFHDFGLFILSSPKQFSFFFLRHQDAFETQWKSALFVGNDMLLNLKIQQIGIVETVGMGGVKQWKWTLEKGDASWPKTEHECWTKGGPTKMGFDLFHKAGTKQYQ